ncbi:PAS domain-containing protein [Gaetbulibacter aestuarii]|uniref:histidine kinase n=1 Tax=Gaetbulibacter aestuarii TaxID=1502358 RepID=A0ABW7MY06_9FLAO
MENHLQLIEEIISLIQTVLDVPKKSIKYTSIHDSESSQLEYSRIPTICKALIKLIKKERNVVLYGDLSTKSKLPSGYKPNAKVQAFVGMPLIGQNNVAAVIFYVCFDKKQSFTEKTERDLNIILEKSSRSWNRAMRLIYLEKEISIIQFENRDIKNIIEAAKIGSWFWDIENEELTISERWAEIIGYTVAELEPVNYNMWANLVYPDDLVIAEKAIESCFLKVTKFYNVSFRMIHKRGHFVWVNSSGFILNWSENNTPLYMVGSHIDITAQKRFEEVSKRNKWHLEEVQKITNIGNWSYDVASKKFQYSESLSDIYKASEKKSFDTILDSIAPEDKAFVQQAKKDCLAFGNPFEIIYRIKKGDGDFLHIEEHGFAVTDDMDNVTNIYGTLHDVTEKKKGQQHLKLLESVITNTMDAVLITEAEPFDKSGPKIVYVNQAFTEMTGYTADEVIGKTPRILQGPKSDRKALNKLGKALRNWESSEITIINYKKNGDEFWINFTVTPVANENGWYTHWIAIERDVTEQMNTINSRILINTISEIFTIEDTLEKSSSLALQKILEFTKYSYGEIWIPNWTNKETTLIASESINAFGNSFKSLQKKEIFKLYDGFQGHILKENKYHYLNKIQENKLFKRSGKAKTAELNTALGFPLKSQNEIVGVLIICSEKNLPESTAPRILLSELEIFLGKEIKRKSLEIEFNEAFNFAPDIITISDNKNYLTKVNPATTKILGYSEEELLSKPINKFIHPDDQNNLTEQREILLSGKPIYNVENRYITKSGKVIWLSWTATPSFRNGLTYSVARDVTEIKKNQIELNKLNAELKNRSEELEKRNEQLKKIAWEQSHQVRAPLARIMSLIEAIDMLEEDEIVSNEKALLISNLKNSSSELDQIIRKLVKKSTIK